jgi:hypothetical protein
MGDDSHFLFRQKLLGEDESCETGRCRVETARSILAKVRGEVFTRFHAVAAKRRSRTRNSQVVLLGLVFRATTTDG